jgi:ATP-binding cassette subfamily B protein
MRRVRSRYVLGAILTVLYAIFFQLVPISVRRISARIATGQPLEAVNEAVFQLVAVALALGFARFASRNVLFRTARRIEYALRNDVLSHLQRLPQSYFAQQRTGDLMSRAVNDINNVRLLLGMGLLFIIQMPILFLGAIGVMVAVDWRLALWVMAPYPLFAGIARLFSLRLHAASLAIQEQLGELSSRVQENASGVFVVRSYVMEDRERRRFEIENESLYKRQVRLAKITATMTGTISLAPTLGMLLVLFAGAPRVLGGSLTQADLWLFFIYTFQLTFPTFMMGWVINVVQRALVGLRRLSEILDTVPAIRDAECPADVAQIVGSVEVKSLSYAFPTREGQAALEGVSLFAEPGQTVGIVGPVGAGKSTLLSAIPRLLEVPDGTVLIDGIDVKRLPLRLLRESVAMVPQDSFLFSATIAENVRFGAPDADLEEVREAARRAHIFAEIEDMPQGFETPVGERGITLSGGQRQRIALARALILNPSILILDDALSSVDTATEEGILKELRAAREGRTCFIVAHRLSSVRDATVLVVLDQGKVVETGAHGELLRSNGLYARIYRQQQLEAEIEGEL